jgi:hypothetical protein
MVERIDPFASLSSPPVFTPRPQREKPVADDTIDRIAEENHFPSRQAVRVPRLPKRKTRIYRTGRNRQFNMKAKPESVDRFYRMADERNVPLGALLDLALDALERANGIEIFALTPAAGSSST